MNGFDHQAYLTLTKYYAAAWKTGTYPAITKNQIFLTARPHSKSAVCTGDSVAQPANAAWVRYVHLNFCYLPLTRPTCLSWSAQTDDNLYAIVFATAAGSLKLSIGSSSSTTSIVAGVNKIKLALAVGSPTATLYNSAGAALVTFAPSGFTYTGSSCTVYNFNYHAAISP